MHGRHVRAWARRKQGATRSGRPWGLCFAAGPPQGKMRPPWGAGSDTQCATVGATTSRFS
ncbi:hypothetical protein DIC66_06280 [Rhodoferax lacus]|uniref:Uncharacterized protein n=1 Tax=Rhodoferax lacus TaxID=2184758 RepID=A0A3E1RDN3_9BURK|nr:hypothetical protein DIC66_06280 [Rhodoferax lacus]